MSTIRRPNESNAPDLSPNVTPMSRLSVEEIAAIAEAEHRHVDYDRHPLQVQGLDHYINGLESNERFRVW
jgi:hypothetical protein